jgi:alpha-L-fucosidase
MFVKPQVEELLRNYQPDLLWFDEIDMKTDAQVEELYNMIRTMRPECIINSRIKGCVPPVNIPPPHCDYLTSGDNEILEKNIGFEWENPGSMNTSYGFNPNDHQWRETKEIVVMLVDIVSKGGNYLLNVGPTPEGLIPQASVDRLLEVGAWMDVNQECIYGASAWKVHGEGPGFENKKDTSGMNIRFTAKGDSVYAVCLSWPEKELLIKTLGAKAYPGRAIKGVRMLGSTETLKWRQSDDGLRLSVPREQPCRHAFVYRIDF